MAVTSVLGAVKFGSLVNKLTGTEFNQFTAHFVQRCGRNAWLSPLMSQTLNSKCETNPEHLNIAINLATTIITSRQSANSHLNIQLDTIPKSLIGEISSYLVQKDHVSFSKSNRSIYIGCNDPNTLQVLDLRRTHDYSRVKLQRFPRLKQLGLKLTQFNQLLLPSNQKILTNLSQLTLDGDKVNDVDLSLIASQKSLDLGNITHLNLYNFGNSGGPANWFSLDTYVQLLSLFPKTTITIIITKHKGS